MGFWNSASAISAAFFIDCAATPALPAADNGRIRPTLIWPVPTGERLLLRARPPAARRRVSADCTPAQAPSKGVPRMRPGRRAASRRAAGHQD